MEDYMYDGDKIEPIEFETRWLLDVEELRRRIAESMRISEKFFVKMRRRNNGKEM